MEIMLILFPCLVMVKHLKLEHESQQHHTGRCEPIHVQGRKRGYIWMYLDAAEKRREGSEYNIAWLPLLEHD